MWLWVCDLPNVRICERGMIVLNLVGLLQRLHELIMYVKASGTTHDTYLVLISRYILNSEFFPLLSRVPSPGMEEAGCSKEMQSSPAHLDLNESPIKSFVSISEATDCLVDFKKQLTVRPGSRTRTKAGRGRRRKP